MWLDSWTNVSLRRSWLSQDPSGPLTRTMIWGGVAVASIVPSVVGTCSIVPGGMCASPSHGAWVAPTKKKALVPGGRRSLARICSESVRRVIVVGTIRGLAPVNSAPVLLSVWSREASRAAAAWARRRCPSAASACAAWTAAGSGGAAAWRWIPTGAARAPAATGRPSSRSRAARSASCSSAASPRAADGARERCWTTWASSWARRRRPAECSGR